MRVQGVRERVVGLEGSEWRHCGTCGLDMNPRKLPTRSPQHASNPSAHKRLVTLCVHAEHDIGLS
jgi:hypothetical protein